MPGEKFTWAVLKLWDLCLYICGVGISAYHGVTIFSNKSSLDYLLCLACSSGFGVIFHGLSPVSPSELDLFYKLEKIYKLKS